jgi:integrase
MNTQLIRSEIASLETIQNVQLSTTDKRLTLNEVGVLWSGLSETTQKRYMYAKKDYVESGFKFPASRNDLIDWIDMMVARDNGINTIKTNLNAIRFFHNCLDMECPINHDVISAKLAGVVKLQHREIRQAHALSLQEVERMVKTCDERGRDGKVKEKGTRDRVLILTGYFGAFRRSELLGIDMADITFSNEGMTINIPVAKTGINQKVSLPCRADDLCPCRAVQELMSILRRDMITEGKLFRSINRWEKWGDSFSDTGMVNMLKTRAEACDIDPTLISGHSLRRGIATELLNSGKDSLKVARHGRWSRVDTVARYYSPHPFKDNVLNGL